MNSLNEAQEKAVQTIEGPLLIVAGAGTGKTRVITQRIINIIRKGANPNSILAITFTNKAANEMKERVANLINKDPKLNLPISWSIRPFISTFHSLGVHIIRENARILGMNRHFAILDRSDSKRVLKESMLQCGIDPKQFDPGSILNLISRAKGEGLNRSEYQERAKGYVEENVSKIWNIYDSILAKENSLDFDDLLLKTAEILQKNQKVLEHYQNIWQYIHVDEYQDTNKIQYKIIKLLASKKRNLCVVGDADQNIYSWRGATIENILNFEKDYPEANVITLEKNYRSTKTILTAANNVIEKNRLRKKKKLFTDNDGGEKISLCTSYTEADEARNVADLANELIKKGVSPNEIAVLFRTNFQSRILEELFIKKNIPYQILGTKFFERKEVKDVISYIRLALNSDSLGDISRIINVPARGIGKASLAKILAGQTETLNDSMREKISTFWKLIGEIKAQIEKNKPSEAIKYAIQASGLEKMLRNGTSEDEERLLNILELVAVAKRYDEMEPLNGMEAFLANCALASDQDDLNEEKNGVRLMTVHAAKGLEFEYVFITGMEQELFPLKHMDEEKIDEFQEEEERRLFYVAITRAKRKVFLSYSIIRSIYGAQKVNLPSEFLEDIEKNLIEDHTPEKPTGAKAIFIDF